MPTITNTPEEIAEVKEGLRIIKNTLDPVYDYLVDMDRSELKSILANQDNKALNNHIQGQVYF